MFESHGSAAYESTSSQLDRRGQRVVPDSNARRIPQQMEQMHVTATSSWFRVLAAGLDVQLAGMSVVDGVITPPGFASAYWVRNLGVSPGAVATGTVYIAMHSLHGGR